MDGEDGYRTLMAALRSLPPWPGRDFHPQEWRRYTRAARSVQRAAPDLAERALTGLVREGEGFGPVENETRAFLVLRLVFALPERAPAGRRRVFKGWTNWPEPDSEGQVNLAWPVGVGPSGPVLLAPYAGSEGPAYDVGAEYRHLLAHCPFRDLGRPESQASGEPGGP